MNSTKLFKFFLLGVFLLMWVGGLLTYFQVIPESSHAKLAAPLFLILAHILIMFSYPKNFQGWLLYVFFVGLASEVVGLSTGFIFGDYQYTSVLGLKVFGTPVAIGSAWVVLAGFVRLFLGYFKLSFLHYCFLASLLMVSIDLVLDPVAANHLNFWTWQTSGLYYDIPTHNFLGWFFVSLIIFIFGYKPNPTASLLGMTVGWLILSFFTLLSLVHNLIIPALIGFSLVLLTGKQFLPKLFASVSRYRGLFLRQRKSN